MPYRINPSFTENYYHVYNRGNNYEKVFFEEKNYEFFLKRLLEYFGNSIALISYCLMPNHFHLICNIHENGSLEKAMQKLSTSYTKAINKSTNRVGHLFQGRYKSKLIPGNDYLLHLSRYIHLNPVRAKLLTKPEDWKYSSYREYIGLALASICSKEIILEQIGGFDKYRKFVMDFDEMQSYFINKLLC